MRRFLVLALAAAAVGAAAVPAARAGSFGRPCTTVTQDQWMSMEAMQAKVQELGYKVRKAKLKNACGEIYALDKNGERVELFVDPTSGQIVGRQ